MAANHRGRHVLDAHVTSGQRPPLWGELGKLLEDHLIDFNSSLGYSTVPLTTRTTVKATLKACRKLMPYASAGWEPTATAEPTALEQQAW